jgi:hypothetical protein
MVGLGEDMGQPDPNHPSQAEALLVAIAGKVLIQQWLYSHALQVGQQQRGVVNSFTDYDKLLGHTESLSQFSKLVQI